MPANPNTLHFVEPNTGAVCHFSFDYVDGEPHAILHTSESGPPFLAIPWEVMMIVIQQGWTGTPRVILDSD